MLFDGRKGRLRLLFRRLPVVMEKQGGAVVNKVQRMVPHQQVRVTRGAVYILHEGVEPDCHGRDLGRRTVARRRVKRRRAGQIVECKIQPGAGVEQMTNLCVRLVASERCVDLGEDQFRHFQPERAADFTGYQFRDQRQRSLPRSAELDHVEPEIDKAVKDAIVVLTGLTAGVTSHAPLWDGLPGNGVGDTEAYHHALIEKYGLNYMAPDRPRFARIDNPPAGSKPATAADAARDKELLATTRRLIDSHFTDFDLVVVPTTRLNPAKINESLAREAKAATSNTPGGDDNKVYDWFAPGGGCMNTSPFDAYGIPAITLPCGFTSTGLPIGLMIAGPHFAEGKVLALAYAYQQATDWHKRRPPLAPETAVPPIIEGKPDAKPGDTKATEDSKEDN